MTSWMPIFVAYLVPAVIGLPLLLLWDRLSPERQLALCRTTSSAQTLRSPSSIRGNSSERTRRMCPNTVGGGRS